MDFHFSSDCDGGSIIVDSGVGEVLLGGIVHFVVANVCVLKMMYEDEYGWRVVGWRNGDRKNQNLWPGEG